MFIVYDDFDEKYLGCFKAKETAEIFKKEYAEKTGYNEDDIIILIVPYCPEVKDVLSPSTYYVTIRNYAEATFTIEANSEEEAEEEAYKLFDNGNDFTYTTEIVETHKEES